MVYWPFRISDFHPSTFGFWVFISWAVHWTLRFICSFTNSTSESNYVNNFKFLIKIIYNHDKYLQNIAKSFRYAHYALKNTRSIIIVYFSSYPRNYLKKKRSILTKSILYFYLLLIFVFLKVRIVFWCI